MKDAKTTANNENVKFDWTVELTGTGAVV